MTPQEIISYCLSKPKAYLDLPFGDQPLCFKLQGKIFAQLYSSPNDFKITLKCTAFAGDLFRQAYPDIVIRGYHCPPVQQPYWNTILLERFPHDELPHMIDLAYETVFNQFPKKVQQQILDS